MPSRLVFIPPPLAVVVDSIKISNIFSFEHKENIEDVELIRFGGEFKHFNGWVSDSRNHERIIELEGIFDNILK